MLKFKDCNLYYRLTIFFFFLLLSLISDYEGPNVFEYFLAHSIVSSLGLCGSQQTVENSSRDGNTRPPDLSPEKSVYRSGRNRTVHGTPAWFQIRKGVCQSCILSPCLFNLYAEYIMRSAGWDEAQIGIKITGTNINNLRYADDTTLMAES